MAPRLNGCLQILVSLDLRASRVRRANRESKVRKANRVHRVLKDVRVFKVVKVSRVPAVHPFLG